MHARSIILTLSMLLSLTRLTAAGDWSAEELVFFENRIRPVLVKHCYECHSVEAKKAKGDLLVDTRDGLLEGGAEGPAVVPNKPEQSVLMRALRYQDDELAMPPEKKGGKLPDEVIADFEKWIRMGAPDPRGQGAQSKVYDAEKAKNWWSYQSLKNPAVPMVSHSNWPRGEIDRFIWQKMSDSGVKPVADADRATLLRRVFLDLIGLPPSPAYAEKFLSSQDPQILEKTVDQLLASRYFGERWGRHWLDVARFAETTGRDVNITTPEAWRYRNYVIDAFAKDKPYDAFIREQLAGDLLPAANATQQAEQWIATGFLAVGPKGINQADPRQFAVDLADEQIDTMSRAFLATTLSCARCHDHKFDPITQRDYTAVAGIFLSSETRYGTPGGVRGRNASDLIDAPAGAEIAVLDRQMDPKVWAAKEEERQRLLKSQEEALASRRRGAEGGVSGFDIVRMMTRAKQLEVEIAAFHPDGSAKARIMGVQDKPVVAKASTTGRGRVVGGPNSSRRGSSGFEVIGDCPLFARGDIQKEGDKVARGLPDFLSGGRDLQIPANRSGRLQLAEWIASTDNTLAARVMVNRVWSWLFGRGLVESVDNFGASGAEPSHPELLDYLAWKFVNNGWSVKSLVREIVLSRVYQLDSIHDEENQRIDPGNRMWWRSEARRLDAETIRDCLLSASGQLDLKSQVGSLIAMAGDGPVGGQRMQVVREEQVSAYQATFRSVYLPAVRNVQPELLAVFDYGDPSMVQGLRETTLVPPQALFMMNSGFVDAQARALAKRVMEEPDFGGRFTLACWLVWCREPTAAELAAAAKHDRGDLASWTSICRAMFASANFLFNN